MARKRTSPADGFVEWVATLPWWVGLALAPICYFFFNWLASVSGVGTVAPGNVPAAMFRSVFSAGATVLKYAVPFVCLVGSVLAVFRSR